MGEMEKFIQKIAFDSIGAADMAEPSLTRMQAQSKGRANHSFVV
jgi:hypothetical protein